ncbi:MAG: nicotinate-nucleotide adenylyltransferase [Clostridia bacterium]|nr:nicotinate-nucleotide adenylyltransferase [Clostridia bacterium]
MRIGLYGGSFNPIHNGHIDVATAVKDEFALDRVLFMVAKDPPHKKVADGVDARTRFAMTQAGVGGVDGFFASDLELQRPGKSYTLYTVRDLREAYPKAEIYCIVGADMLLELSTWYEAETLLRETSFIGVGRSGVEGDLEAEAARLHEVYGASIYLSRFEGPHISSTAIRQAIEDALPIAQWIPQSVEAFIYEEGVYLPDDFQGMQQKLRQTLKEKRYKHTMGTVRCAIELAARYGADGKKARLAALLHDCAKFDIPTQIKLCAQYDVDITELLAISPAIIHGPLGAAIAKTEYGVTDEVVLSAIYWHTLCREKMTKLEKIIYLADKIEPNRDFAGVEAIREAARRGLDYGVLACMDRSIDYVHALDKALHPNVLRARTYIREHIKEDGN